MPHLVDMTMFFAPEGGGVKRYLKAKHRWLLDRPHWRHSLLVPGGRGARDNIGHVSIPSPRIPFANGYRFPINNRRWRETLDRLKPDIIEAGDPYQLAWTTQSVANDLGIPAAGFYHSDLTRLIAMRIGTWSRHIVDAYVRRLYAGFDLVFAPSEIMCDKLRGLGVRHVVHQPLGVDTELFRPELRDPKLRSRLGIDNKKKLCIFAGRFAQEKNIPLLLAAFQKLGCEYHLLLVGSGTKFPAQHNVSVISYRSSTQALARLLASCDLLVHAGDNETFGLIVLEAMACGLPAVGVNAGAIPELIDDSTGELAYPGDVDSFAEAVDSVFRRGAQQLGANAVARMRRHYSWEQTFALQEKHYFSLLTAPGTEPAVPAFAIG